MLYRTMLIGLISVGLIGCKPALNPGTWEQGRVEAKLKEKLKLVEVSLLPHAAGGYTGSGKTKQGETYTLRVKQNAELKQLSWEFSCNRGDVGEEVFEIVKVE